MEIEFIDILKVNNKLIEKIRIWRNSENVNKYMLTNHFITVEEHQKWIEKLQNDKTFKVWIIKYKNKPAGIVSLSNINIKNRTTEWGFYIADKSLQGRGIGSTVLYNLIEYVFNTLNLNIMKTTVLENNPIALKMYENFGFIKIQKNDKIKRQDETINVFLMELKKENWKKIKKNLTKPLIKIN